LEEDTPPLEDANNPSTDPLDENFEGEIEPAELHEPIEIPEPSHPAPDFILKGPILPAVVRLAWPIWIAVALQDAYTLVDLFWVGKLGRDPVAAIALCGVLMGMAFTVAIGLATGVVAMVSRFVGAGKREAAWAVAWQALYMGVAAGALSTVLGLLLAGPALRLLGAEGNVLGLGTVYLQVLACGSAALFLTFSLNSALRGVGDTITPMVAMGMGTCVNLVLDPLLIFGWLGFPRLGVMGSALATVIAQGLSLTFILLALFSGRVPIRLRLSRAQLDLRLCWRILRIGIFGSLQMWVSISSGPRRLPLSASACGFSWSFSSPASGSGIQHPSSSVRTSERNNREGPSTQDGWPRACTRASAWCPGRFWLCSHRPSSASSIKIKG
jgi:hypothetical protein